MEQRWCLANRKTKSMEKDLYANQVAQRVVQGRAQNTIDDDWMVWYPGWASWKPLIQVAELMDEIQILAQINSEVEDGLNVAIPQLPPSFENEEEPAADEESKVASAAVIHLVKPVTVTTVPESESMPRGSELSPSNSNTSEESAPTSLTALSPLSEALPKTPETKPLPQNSKSGDSFANRRKHPRYKARYRCIIRSSTVSFRTFTVDISLGGVALEDSIPQELLGVECQIYISSSKTKSNLKFKIAMTSRGTAKYFSFEGANPATLSELQGWLESENLSLVA